jgi:hypothetical protein
VRARERLHRRHQHDPAATARAQPRAEVVREQERPAAVQPLQEQRILDRLIEESLRNAIRARVVDEQSDVEVARRAGDRLRDLRAGQVALDRARLDAVLRAQLCGDALERLAAAPDHCDVETAARELLRERLADPVGPARDHRPWSEPLEELLARVFAGHRFPPHIW